MTLGNREDAVQCIACPLCRCKCALPPSGHFPSCVKNDDMRKAHNLQNNDDTCAVATASCATQTEQTLPNMITQIAHQALSKIRATTLNMLSSVSLLMFGTIMPFASIIFGIIIILITSPVIGIFMLIKAPFRIGQKLSDIFELNESTIVLVFLSPIMFTLGLVSVALRFAGKI